MIALIISLLATLGLVILWHFLWKDYALDKLRDELFSIRNDLFDLADENKGLEFKSSTYQTLEEVINGVIRFGHNISLSRSIIFYILNKIKYPNLKIKSKLQKEYDNLENSIKDRELREKIAWLKYRFESEIVMHMIRTSLTVLSIAILLYTRSLVMVLFSKVKDSMLDVARAGMHKSFLPAINSIEYQAQNNCGGYR